MDCPGKLWVQVKSTDSGVVNSAVQVPAEGCKNVDDLTKAIKKELAPKLDQFSSDDITLHLTVDSLPLECDLSLVSIASRPEFVNTAKFPLIVKVHLPQVLPPPAISATGSSRKQIDYREICIEFSCIKYLDAIANELYRLYDFDKTLEVVTMSDLLAAKDGQQGKPITSTLDVAWWDYRKVGEVPLPEVYTPEEWDVLESLNRETIEKIYDGVLIRNSSQKPVVVLPHSMFTNDIVESVKRMAAMIGTDDLVVMHESEL